ncbi:MAG: hypothetical protein IJR46_01440, partial [Neisseriaceae bacterium]|nr:hypothetical protein [Neisseriaceae bacterium]
MQWFIWFLIPSFNMIILKNRFLNVDYVFKTNVFCEDNQYPNYNNVLNLDTADYSYNSVFTKNNLLHGIAFVINRFNSQFDSDDIDTELKLIFQYLIEDNQCMKDYKGFLILRKNLGFQPVSSQENSHNLMFSERMQKYKIKKQFQE